MRHPEAKRKKENHNIDVEDKDDDGNPRRRRIAEAAAHDDLTVVDEASEVPVTSEVIALPRKRGRPKKTTPKSSVFEVTKSPPRKRGRLRKNMD